MIYLGYMFDAAMCWERVDSLESTLLRREGQASNGAIRYQYQFIDIAIKF